MLINTYDIDGVIFLGEYDGVRPGPHDMIITGRSWEEFEETHRMLKVKGINNRIFFNPRKFDEKTRESSGVHKAETILYLIASGYQHGIHFEDDEIQIEIIKKMVPNVRIVHMVQNIVTKENVRHV